MEASVSLATPTFDSGGLALVVRYAWSVTSLRNVVKRVLPTPALEAYRRRRALRRYLRSLAYEIHDRNRTYPLEELEGQLLRRRPDLTRRLMDDLLKRTDLLIKELDRQIEALRARHGSQLADLGREVEALRDSLEALRGEMRDRAGAQSPTRGAGVD
jgi:hypothetical protein